MTYHFGFAMTMALGNSTRFANLRKYAERDPEVVCEWAPITHWLEPDPYRRLPEPLHRQMVVSNQARPVTRTWRHLDAVVVHGFQLFSWLSLRPRRRRLPVRVLSQDYAPFKTADHLRAYGQDVKDDWRRRQRVRLEMAFTRRADLLVPFSEWAAGSLEEDTGVPRERIEVIHPGVDLELWRVEPLPERPPGEPVRLLFVGGDFERKGGELLLDVFGDQLQSCATLDIVTREPLDNLPPGVQVFNALVPNDPTLRRLYTDCDIFVLPTRADMSSHVALEAMATGRPVITTSVGGVGEVIGNGSAGIVVPPDDPVALAAALRRLIDDPDARRALGAAGRERVEQHYSAERATARLLATLKRATDERRSVGGR